MICASSGRYFVSSFVIASCLGDFPGGARCMCASFLVASCKVGVEYFGSGFCRIMFWRGVLEGASVSMISPRGQWKNVRSYTYFSLLLWARTISMASAG